MRRKRKNTFNRHFERNEKSRYKRHFEPSSEKSHRDRHFEPQAKNLSVSVIQSVRKIPSFVKQVDTQQQQNSSIRGRK
ncbi:MAG: hypothetical protein J6M05_06065 [Cardiobacteriaceae bacterium]|nr:hypothetical protein [Cardiobacteriaceae bacterium]